MHKRPIVFAVAVAAALVLPGLPAVAKYHHTTLHHKHHAATKRVRVAPADEYFGRMKMSILGIGNQLRDLDLRLRYSPEKGADVLGSAAFVEDALHDWEHKYPTDPWLPKDVYKLAHLYANVHTNDGRRHASSALHWLMVRYGGTHYGRLARTELAAVLK